MPSREHQASTSRPWRALNKLHSLPTAGTQGPRCRLRAASVVEPAVWGVSASGRPSAKQVMRYQPRACRNRLLLTVAKPALQLSHCRFRRALCSANRDNPHGYHMGNVP